MAANPRLKPVTLAFLLSAMGAGLYAGGLDDNPVVQLVKYLFKPFADNSAAVQRDKKFKEKTKYAVVITNEYTGKYGPPEDDWTFNWSDEYEKELPSKPSGTMKVSEVKSDGLELWPPVIMDGKDHGDDQKYARKITIRRNFGTIVIEPVVTKSGIMSWEKFARVCYLQDSKGKRVYVTITKDTSNSALPQVGFAKVSEAVAKDNKVLQFPDPSSDKYNIIGIKVSELTDK